MSMFVGARIELEEDLYVHNPAKEIPKIEQLHIMQTFTKLRYYTLVSFLETLFQ